MIMHFMKYDVIVQSRDREHETKFQALLITQLKKKLHIYTDLN